MTDQQPTPKPPTVAQPVTTMVAGIAIETGHVPVPGLTPRAALELEDQRVFGRTAPPDFDTLRRACHQAPDVMPLKRFYDGDELSDAPEWRGTRVEIIAFPLAPYDPDGTGGGTIRVPLGHPWAFWEFPGIDGPCIVARWCHRHPGRPGVPEVAWDGRRWFATQTKRSVHFLGGEGSVADAARLMALWVATTEASIRRRRGPRKHYTAANEQEFFEDLGRTAHAAMAEGEQHLTPASLSRHGIGDRRIIGDALTLYGYDVDKVEEEVRQCQSSGGGPCRFVWRRRSAFKVP